MITRLTVTLLAVLIPGWRLFGDMVCTVTVAVSPEVARVTSVGKAQWLTFDTQNNAVLMKVRSHTLNPGALEAVAAGFGYASTSLTISPYESATTYTGRITCYAEQAGVEFKTMTDAESATTPAPPSADTCSQTCWTTCKNGICPQQPEIEWCTPYCSPLVLDLDGNGIQTTGVDDPVMFDIDGDGTLNLVAWLGTGSGDAFLWRDAGTQHRVDDGSELFGSGMILGDGHRASNGFEALASYDRADNGGNEDGAITKADEIWRRLRLWIDENHNGISEPTEIVPIQMSCVESLSLRWVPSDEMDAAGNQVRMKSTYECRIAGNVHEERPLVDVFFRVFQ